MQRIVEAFGDDRIAYESMGANLGAAGGAAAGAARLLEAGYDWIHFVDDDNPPRTPTTLERLCQLIDRYPEPDGVGAVAGTGSRWDWRRGRHDRIPDAELLGDVDIDTTGGGQQFIVRREAMAAVGPPEADLFFGFYDPLYCLRIRTAGYRIVIPGEMALESRARAGRLDFERKPAFRPRDPEHAIWRRYYVTRNYIHEMRRTFDRPALARREAFKALARSTTAWFRGPRYGARFTTLELRGILDGYRDRLGRTVEPVAKPGR